MTLIRVVDFETTGTEPPEAEVCEVGTCDLDLEGRAVLPPESYLCGVCGMPPEAQAIHHISLDECRPHPAFDPAGLSLWLADAVAAHNAKFELQFFTATLPVICTYKAALRVWPDAPGHGNGVLRYWLEQQGKIHPDHALTQPAHRAGPDAYTTAHILLALFDAGATGRQMVGWTREPPLMPTCPIGKFRGKPWADVETGFLNWMVDRADMEPDLKWNAERALAARGLGGHGA